MRKIYYTIVLSVLFVLCGRVAAQTASLPYQEKFDSYDPSTVKLPEGWASEGVATFKIGAYNDAYCEPYSAPYYIVTTGYDQYPRRDWLYTPGFNMEAGKTYYASFWIFAAGYIESGFAAEKFKFTVGNAQTKEAQTVILKDVTGQRFKEWTQIKGEFKPETSGIYYFAVNIYTESKANGVGFDDFEVFSEDNPLPVVAQYMPVGGIWSATTANMKNRLRYVYPDQPINFVNQSKYAASYSWQTFGNPEMTTEENPEVTYTTSGFYEPILTSTNKAGSQQYKDTVNVIVIGEEEVTDIISNRDKYDGPYLGLPYDIFNNAYEFTSGINRYYNTFAERFDMPEGAKVKINSVSLMLYQFKLATADRLKKVTVKVYGDAGGVPDANIVFGSYQTTMRDAFGTASIVEEGITRTIKFDTPIEVTGTYYVSIEIDDSLIPSKATSLGAICLRKANYDTKACVYIKEKDVMPEPALELPEGWYVITELPGDDFSGFEGLSFYLAPSVTFPKSDENSIGGDTRSETTKVYPAVFDNVLNIETEDTDAKTVLVYNVNGQKIYEGLTIGNNTTVETGAWSSGIYIVNVIGKSERISVKVVKL